MANTPKDSIKTRKVAFLVADGFDDAAVLNMAKAIEAAGAMADISSEEAPSEILEERIADAAEMVLAEQVNASSGDELLAPDRKKDDRVAPRPVRAG